MIEKLKSSQEDQTPKPEINLITQIDTSNVDQMARVLEAQGKEIEQRIEAAEKKRKQENAWEILKDSEENWAKRRMSEMAEIVRDATGRDLIKEVDSMAKKNLKERGVRICKISEVRPQLINSETLKVSQERYSEALLSCFGSLSAEERAGYYERNGAINIAEFQKYVEEKITKLGISKEQFGQLVRDDIDVLHIKERGFFERLISFGMMGKYVISRRDGLPPVSLSDKQFKDFLALKEEKAKETIKTEVEKRVDEKIIQGRKRWLKEKQVCTRSIIREIVKSEEQKKEESVLEIPTPEKQSSISSETEETQKPESSEEETKSEKENKKKRSTRSSNTKSRKKT
mgnify:CR=1 FL=1